MKQINWGIIGLGNIAQKFSEGFINVPNSNLFAIASKNKIKLNNFKKKFNLDEQYSFNNYDDLLKCKEVDIIYITLPNFLHYDWILKCIEHKKSILIEKPALLSYSQATDIEKSLIENRIFFTENYMYRYHPLIRKLIELVKENIIGDLINMESNFGLNIMTKKKFFFFKKNKKIDKNNRLFNKEMGGGCIFDLGCYTTSISLLVAALLKEIDTKNVTLKNIKKKIGPTHVDIDAEAELIFNDSFRSYIKTSFIKNLGNKTIITGEKGKIILERSFLDIGGLTLLKNGKKSFIYKPSLKNLYFYGIESISKSIIDDKIQYSFPIMSIEETLINTKIIDNWVKN